MYYKPDLHMIISTKYKDLSRFDLRVTAALGRITEIVKVICVLYNHKRSLSSWHS